MEVQILRLETGHIWSLLGFRGAYSGASSPAVVLRQAVQSFTVCNCKIAFDLRLLPWAVRLLACHLHDYLVVRPHDGYVVDHKQLTRCYDPLQRHTLCNTLIAWHFPLQKP